MYFSALTTSASAASLPTLSAPFFFAILTTAAIGKSAIFLTSKRKSYWYIYILFGKIPYFTQYYDIGAHTVKEVENEAQNFAE